MATTSKKTAVSASRGQQAEDLLWKFQLRKEHNQLLARLDAHQEQLSAFASETQSNCQKLHARLNTIEKKVDKLEADDKELGQESSKIHNELQALKEKVGSIAGNPHRTVPTSSENLTITEKALLPHRQMLHQRMLHSSAGPASTNHMPPPSNPFISSNSTDGIFPEVAAKAPEPPTQILAERKLASSDPIIHKSVEPIRQGTYTLKEYLQMADRLVADLPNRPFLPITESDVVGMFIDGLTNEEERKTIIESVQSKELCTFVPSRDGGKETVFVSWSAFKEAMRRSRLLEITHDMESRALPKVTEPSKTTRSVENGNSSAVTKKEMGPRQKKKRTLY